MVAALKVLLDRHKHQWGEARLGALEAQTLNAQMEVEIMRRENRERKEGAQKGAIVDTRVLNKPTDFKGSDEEWSDWSFVFRSYMALVDAEMARLAKEAEAMTAAVTMPVDADVQR